MIIERAFTEQLHARGTGAQGGQFVAKGGSQPAPAAKATAAGKGKPAGGGNLSFDGKRGAGYGKKGGDPRVHKLQDALNRLGFTDGSGKKLAKDGKLGPRTTAAIKKAQRAMGLKADGVVTPALLAKLAGAKSAKDLKAKPKKAAPARKAAAPSKGFAKQAGAPVAKKAAPVVVKRSVVGYSGRMTSVERHLPGKHNQQAHANRIGRPTNVAGKTGLGKATAALADKPALGPAPAPKARDLSSPAQRKAAVEEYDKLTKNQFDALPEEDRNRIIDELRTVVKDGEYDTSTGRGSVGMRYRGQAEHVSKAKFMISNFRRTVAAPVDNSVDGRASRLKSATTDSEARAALHSVTVKDMDKIAEKNGWLGGTSSGWKKDKWIDHLVRKALEGK